MPECVVCGRTDCNTIEALELASLPATRKAVRARLAQERGMDMPEVNEYVGANMVERTDAAGNTVLVHPDDVEQFDNQQADLEFGGGNDAAIMQEVRSLAERAARLEEEHATAVKAQAKSEAKAQKPAEDK